MPVSYALLILGLLVAILGIYIWTKQAVQFVSRHANVKDSDVKAFTKLNGISAIGLGISLILLGVFNYLDRMNIGLIVFMICFVISMMVFLAHKQNITDNFLKLFWTFSAGFKNPDTCCLDLDFCKQYLAGLRNMFTAIKLKEGNCDKSLSVILCVISKAA